LKISRLKKKNILAQINFFSSKKKKKNLGELEKLKEKNEITSNSNFKLFLQQLIEQIKSKSKSFLAIGLDVDLNKIQNIFRTRRSDF
jgi:uncharacterized protein YnzC (UPF0291/DUF896 family)